VVKGYHVLRHSFMVGHQTEAMRRRYRHLYPQTVANAVKRVFG
jgi:hypothetical protein